MSSETRLVGGIVLTQDDDRSVIRGGEVAFDRATGRISYVGPVRGSGDDGNSDTIDATGRIVMPGLVNSHTHSGMMPLRGYAEDMNLQDWLGRVRSFEVKLTAEDLFYGLQLALVEMLRSGTTTFADMFLWDSAMLASVAESGMRVLAAPAIFGYDAVGYPAASPVDGRGVLTVTESLATEFVGDNQIRIAYGPHAPYSCSPELLGDIARRAQHLGLRVQIHLSESAFEVQACLEQYGRTPIVHVAELGLFDSPVLVAHGTHATEADIELLAVKSAAVAHNPVSNAKLGAGIAPIPGYLEAGVTLGLGTDSVASNNNLDLFEEIKTGALMQRGYRQSPDIVRSADLLDMATVGGAVAAGFPEVGSLQVGKAADIIILDTANTRATPLHDPAAFLTFAASGVADVRDVYIGGRHVMAAGVVRTVDEELVRAKVAETGDRIRRELGTGVDS